MRVLFVSPHADDVCFSLTGVVANLDVPKHLVTVFSDSQWAEPDWQGPRDRQLLTAARSLEDRSFCSVLGLAYHSLGLPDSSIRHARLGDLRVTSGDEELLLATAEEGARRIIKAHDIEVLVGPLGLGHHADHIVCRDLTARLGAEMQLPVAYYEDLPYAGVLAFLSIALRAARLDPNLRPVACRTTMPIDDKLQAIRLYESQTEWAHVRALLRHNGRLARRVGVPDRAASDNRRTSPADRVRAKRDGLFVVERLWTSESPAWVRDFLGRGWRRLSAQPVNLREAARAPQGPSGRQAATVAAGSDSVA